jgi:hypothetical protein
MARAYKVSGKMTLDTRTFRASISEVSKNISREARVWQKHIGSFSRAWASSGRDMLLFGAVGAFAIKKLVDHGSEIADFSKQLGMTSSALSEIAYAGSLSGVELNKLVTSIGKMQKTLGSGAADDMLKRIGLDPKRLKELSSEDAFTGILDAIGKLSNQSDRMNLAQGVFGKGGGELLRLSKEGAAGLNALREEARALGLSIDQDTANRLDEMGDNFDRLMGRAKGLGMAFKMQLTPAIETTIDMIGGALRWVGEFTAAHPKLVEWVGKGAFAIAAYNLTVGGLKFTVGSAVNIFTDLLSSVVKVTGWIGKLTAAKRIATVATAADTFANVGGTAATVADTKATVANTASKMLNARARKKVAEAVLLEKAFKKGGPVAAERQRSILEDFRRGKELSDDLGRMPIGKASISIGTATLAISAAALLGGYIGKKMWNAGWANEGSWHGAILGGTGRKVGDWLGSRHGDKDLGERSRQLMTEGRVAIKDDRAVGAVDEANKRLMENQNRILERQNEMLKRIADNTGRKPGQNQLAFNF